MKKNLTATIAALLLTATTLTAQNGPWDCGDPNVNGGQNVIATLSNNVLTISGNGAMADYGTAPWSNYAYLFNTVIIEDGVTSIGNHAFSGNYNLDSIAISNSVTTIGNNAFAQSKLASIYLGNNITTIGYSAFYGCYALKKLIIADGPNPLTLMVTDASNFANCNIETVYMGRNVIHSGNVNVTWAMFHMGVRYLTLGSGVTVIPNYAFYGCYDLTSLTMGSSVKTIGSYAFANCSKVTSITIGNGVDTIGNSAFSGCSALKTLIIADGPNPLTLMVTSESNFAGCYIETVHLGRNVIRSREDVTWALFHMGVKYLTIGNGVTTINNAAFSGCYDLTSLAIGDNVTTIGSSAFSNCPSLKSVTIGSSVETIGEQAFASCNITSIVSLNTTPPHIQPNTFCVDNYNICLGVPVAAQQAYRDSLYWSNFWNNNSGCAKAAYTVAFNSQGGAEVETQYIIDGNKAIEPTAPTRANHSFEGWFIDNGTFLNAWDFDADVVTQDTTLHAKWSLEDDYHTVTFVDHDGTELGRQMVESGSHANAPPEPTRTGYTFKNWDVAFDGWFTDDNTFLNKWNFAVNVVTQDTTLYAKWTVKPFCD